ncbi:hypothetical protein MMEU_5224 [Mycobacterium marinum str. Europe]|nr:hypothetical protein MMEU_5224 [Mycobacterium marinum str. Europe]
MRPDVIQIVIWMTQLPALVVLNLAARNGAFLAKLPLTNRKAQ